LGAILVAMAAMFVAGLAVAAGLRTEVADAIPSRSLVVARLDELVLVLGLDSRQVAVDIRCPACERPATGKPKGDRPC
jgi:hypothetical protein